MSQSIRWLGVLVAVAAGAFSMPASALQWTWESDNASPNTQQITSNNCGTSGGGAGNASGCEQFTVTVGGQALKVRAYSAPTLSTANPPSGSWSTASLGNYTGGFGVTNRVSGDTGEGADPEHATDNNQVVDILVFELPGNQVWDLDAFQLGWARESGSNQADVQAWFGGTGLADNYDFTTVCFTGCATGHKSLTSSSPTGLGFASLGTFENVQQGSAGFTTVSGTQAGRYLVMAGQLGETNDAFKLEMLKATGTTPPGGQTPVPGTLALLGLGLVGLRSMRRRAAQA